MEFTVQCDTLLESLQSIGGIIENRQTMPILSNVLLSLEGPQLSLTTTDTEIEMATQIPVLKGNIDASLTVPGRKLIDICRNLPGNSQLAFSLKKQKVSLNTGYSQYSLAPLPADAFPVGDYSGSQVEFTIPQNILRRLFDKTSFTIAQQEVRTYLKGLLLEIGEGRITAAAADGHRLSVSYATLDADIEQTQVLIPRKGIVELARSLKDSDDPVTVKLSQNHIQVLTTDLTFSSKLIESRFPDYKRIIPQANNSQEITMDRKSLKLALTRAAILSNDKIKGILLNFTENNSLAILANNNQHESAEEELPLLTNTGSELQMGVNVQYVLEALNSIETDQVKLTIPTGAPSVLVEPIDNSTEMYVIMSMRL